MKRGVCVGDLHSGSIYAVLPPAFEMYDGSVKLQNPAQEYLWRCWEDFCWRAGQLDPDFIEVGGDDIEGPQRKSNGYELSLACQDDQVKASVQTLQLLKARCPRAKWFFIKGTPYHVGEWGSAEESIAQQLGAEQYSGPGPGKYCKRALWMDAEGVILEFAHHIGGASGFYRMTALDREGQWSAMAGKDATKGIPKADLLIRHHVHFFGNVEHESKQIVAVPCWKLQDDWAAKGGLHRFHPTIGGVLVEIDGALKKDGENPCRIRRIKYSNPPVPIVTL